MYFNIQIEVRGLKYRIYTPCKESSRIDQCMTARCQVSQQEVDSELGVFSIASNYRSMSSFSHFNCQGH